MKRADHVFESIKSKDVAPKIILGVSTLAQCTYFPPKLLHDFTFSTSSNAYNGVVFIFIHLSDIPCIHQSSSFQIQFSRLPNSINDWFCCLSLDLFLLILVTHVLFCSAHMQLILFRFVIHLSAYPVNSVHICLRNHVCILFGNTITLLWSLVHWSTKSVHGFYWSSRCQGSTGSGRPPGFCEWHGCYRILGPTPVGSTSPCAENTKKLPGDVDLDWFEHTVLTTLQVTVDTSGFWWITYRIS